MTELKNISITSLYEMDGTHGKFQILCIKGDINEINYKSYEMVYVCNSNDNIEDEIIIPENIHFDDTKIFYLYDDNGKYCRISTSKNIMSILCYGKGIYREHIHGSYCP